MYFNALHAFFSLISLILSCALPAAPPFPAFMNSWKWYCLDLILLCILNNLFFNSCQDGLNPWILDVNFPENNYHSIWPNVEAIDNRFVLPIAWSRVSPHRKLTVAAVLGLRNVTGETFSAHFQQRLINKLPLWKGKCCVFLGLIMRSRVLNVRLCESGRLSEWEQRVSATPGHIAFCAHWYYATASPSVPLVSNISSQFVFLFSAHPHIIPSVPPPSLPAAQSYHTGSLFLANLSLIHYWDLFFFLESQNEEKGTDLLNFWCGAWKM